MSQMDGVLANHTLVTILTGLHGKEVLVETKHGDQWYGLFAACSPELEIGLRYAYMKTAENEANLLPKKKETKEKITFKYSDVVTVSALISEEKIIKGFATDRDYHHKANDVGDEGDLQEWECEDDGEDIMAGAGGNMPEQRNRNQRNGGWSVDEMFNANSQLGVQSTFDHDMKDYTTADVEGTEADRQRAERIAREIENNSQSKYYARLENDDDERDLDKQTTEDDFDFQKSKNQRGSYTNRNGRGGGPPTNRRAEGMKANNPAERRGGGGGPNRYSQGGYNSQRGQTYVPGQTKRPTGAELQEQFNDWENRKDIGGKIYENSNLKSQQMQSKVVLENRAGSSNRGSSDKTATGGAARRADGLREWNNEFSTNYRGPKTGTPEKETTPVQSPAKPLATAAPAPTGNAWTKGPPTSLLNTPHSASSPPAASPSAQPSASPVAAAVPNTPTAPATPASTGNTEPAPGCSAVKEKDTSVPAQEAKGESNEKAEKESAVVVEKAVSEVSEDSSKKFSFNPDAPVFTPRAPTTPTPIPQGAQVSQIPQPMPVHSMAAVSIAGVPGGIQSGMPPPGVAAAMPGQPLLIPWGQGGAQPYASVQMQGQFPQYMIGNQVMAMPRPGGPAPQIAYAAAPQNQRRPNGPPAGAMMVQPGGQWPNQIVMQQGVVPYAYPSTYPMSAAGGPPQQYAAGPQMMPQAQQMPPQGVYQQRYPAPHMSSYVIPGSVQQGQTQQQQQRYPTPQQTPHQGHDASYQGGGPQGSAASTHGSQPPTPGPQQPQPVASPAQPHSNSAGRGSPANMAPSQQFSHGPAAVSQQQQQQQMMSQHQQQQQQYYQPQSNMYYPQAGGIAVYSMPGAMPTTHSQASHPDQHHMAPQQQHHAESGGGMMATPHQQQYGIPHEQYGTYVHGGAAAGQYYAQQQQAHQQQQQMQQQQGAQGIQHQQQQQPMSRQNSVPQSTYGNQGSPPGISQQQQQSSGPPLQAQSSVPAQQQ